MALAQLDPKVKLLIDVNVSDARRRVKRAMAEINEANRALARLENQLSEFGKKLAQYGIRVEVSE